MTAHILAEAPSWGFFNWRPFAMDHHERNGDVPIKRISDFIDFRMTLGGIASIVSCAFIISVALYSGWTGDREHIGELLRATHSIQEDFNVFKSSMMLQKRDTEDNKIHIVSLEAHYDDTTKKIAGLEQEASNLKLRLDNLNDAIHDLIAASRAQIRNPNR